MTNLERSLAQWRAAGLIDEPTEAAILRYENSQAAPGGRRWQVVVALVLGGILLGAGVLLFVAAHWDDVSPNGRLALVMAMLALFHVAGIACADRFPGFATTMHALGTIASGGAIALVGQIFNMEEHWPAAVMLWAFCAVAGWALLRDEFQETLALILVPAWIISEWTYRTESYSGSEVYLWRMIAIIAAVYLTGFLRSGRRIVFGILFAVGCVALAIATGFLAEEGWRWLYYGLAHDWGFIPLPYRLWAYAILLLSLVFAWFANRRSLAPVGVVAAAAFVLPWLRVVIHTEPGYTRWNDYQPSIALYAVVAATCVFLAWWGVRETSKAIVNYAIAAFALTVMWFYFSDIMGKLDRSLGLIVLGALFLAGGWMLEKMRRRLVASISQEAA
jgi:uncharacterized membrane protein